MKILGIDYGEKKVGLSLAASFVAEPFRVIRYKNQSYLIDTIKEVIEKEGVDKIVIGISEGKMEKKIKKFGKILKEAVSFPVVYQDETLSTYEANKKSIEAGVNRKKRHRMEDAFSATIILQSYLEKAK